MRGWARMTNVKCKDPTPFYSRPPSTTEFGLMMFIVVRLDKRRREGVAI